MTPHKTYTVKKAFTDKAGRPWTVGENYLSNDAAETAKQVQAGTVAEDTSDKMVDPNVVPVVVLTPEQQANETSAKVKADTDALMKFVRENTTDHRCMTEALVHYEEAAMWAIKATYVAPAEKAGK